MKTRNPNYRLGAVLAVALFLRLVYALETPAWQAADEYPHFWVAQKIAATGEFPRSEPVFPSYEAFQPPLYYSISAGLLRLCDKPELAYTEQMIRPPAPLLVLRLLSVLLGVGVVWAIYRSARQAWPGGGELPLLAALFAALLPAFVVVSSSVTNEALLTFFSAVFFMVIAAPLQDWNARRALFAGIWVGLAILTKLSGLVLLVPLAWRLFQLRARLKGGRIGLSAAVGIVLCLGLLVARDVAMYGRFPAVNPGLAREFTFRFGHIIWALRNMVGSFFFAAGRIYEIRPSVLVYALTVGPMLLFAAVGCSRKGGGRCASDLRGPLAAGLVGGIALSLVYTLSYPEGTMTSWGKNLYPALTAAALFSVDGWRNSYPKLSRAIPGVFLALLAAGCAWGLCDILSLYTDI